MTYLERLEYEYKKALDTRRIQSKEQIVLNASEYVQLDYLRKILKNMQLNQLEQQKLFSEKSIFDTLLLECKIAEARINDKQEMAEVVRKFLAE